MARSDPQLNFRIPVELRSKLEEAAARNNRSLTAELVERLEASFEVPPAHELSAVLDREIESLTYREGSVATRLEVLRMRLDSLLVRKRDMDSAMVALDSTGTTDDELEQLVGMQEQYRELQSEIDRLSSELAALAKDRAQLLQDIQDRRALLQHSRQEILKRIEEGQKKRATK